ncbi:MAG: type II secretion system F family protein [Egibacteraceae bacterium]
MTGALDVKVLAGLRAALSAGASPATALEQCGGEGVLSPVVRAVRVGQPLARAAAAVDTGDPAADLLVRALGVADHAGAGAVSAVEQALDSVRDEAALRRLLRVRTAAARGAARVLTALPVLLWALLVLIDRRAIGFYRTAPGAVTGLLALALIAAGHAWSRRIVAAAGRAAAAADPCDGAAAETIDLVAVAMAGGLSPPAALQTVAALAPLPTRQVLARASRRLSAGSTPDEAFSGTGLAALGEVLATVERWGAPSGPVLSRLAADLRAEVRAAAEEAGERVELHLVFPTTLLTLPAFVLGIVPPLLWTALTAAGGASPS